MDPELAMALKVSMEEERARQTDAAKEEPKPADGAQAEPKPEDGAKPADDTPGDG